MDPYKLKVTYYNFGSTTMAGPLHSIKVIKFARNLNISTYFENKCNQKTNIYGFATLFHCCGSGTASRIRIWYRFRIRILPFFLLSGPKQWIRDKHPGSATLTSGMKKCLFDLSVEYHLLRLGIRIRQLT